MRSTKAVLLDLPLMVAYVLQGAHMNKIAHDSATLPMSYAGSMWINV